MFKCDTYSVQHLRLLHYLVCLIGDTHKVVLRVITKAHCLLECNCSRSVIALLLDVRFACNFAEIPATVLCSSVGKVIKILLTVSLRAFELHCFA